MFEIFAVAGAAQKEYRHFDVFQSAEAVKQVGNGLSGDVIALLFDQPAGGADDRSMLNVFDLFAQVVETVCVDQRNHFLLEVWIGSDFGNQADKFLFVFQLGFQMIFIVKFEIKRSKIAVDRLNPVRVGGDQLFVVAVDDAEEVAVVFADFQNVAEVKAEIEFF